MTQKKWQTDTLIGKELDDGWTYYARLLEFPWVAFYRHRTKGQSHEFGAIAPAPVLFTIAAHQSLLARNEWKPIGRLPADPAIRRPHAQAMFNDPRGCRIINDQNVVRWATPKECEGLEPAAVWEPEHIADRLKDEFAGRPNRWLTEMLPPRG